MFSLNAVGIDLIQPLVNAPDFVDFPREPLPFGRSKCGVDWVGDSGELEEGVGGEL